MQKKIKCEIYRDSMQNYKKYGIRPAQLIIADVPYCCGNNFYGSNPMWYKGGDNANGAWIRALHTVSVCEKLQPAGFESQYADCRSYRVRIGVLSG